MAFGGALNEARAPLTLDRRAVLRPSVSAGVVGTVFLIAGEVMLFAGLVFAFWVLRLAAPAWPPPLQPRLPVGLTAANTVVLFASSAAMAAATRTIARGRSGALAARLGLCALLGVLFLAVQGYEWIRLIGFGLTVSSGIYGALFYTLIGTHAAHVVAALVWLTAVLVLTVRGRVTPEQATPLTTCALYWHFVVGLWPVIYVSVYVA
jgi:cytochrome c oxidase subunit III